VKVTCGKRDTGLFIPLDAIIGPGSRHAVFIVKEDAAKRRLINTGAITGDNVEVFSHRKAPACQERYRGCNDAYRKERTKNLLQY
jgi:hypothetical protein